MIDLYDFAEEMTQIFEQCQTPEEIENVEKRLIAMIKSQGILVKEYMKAGLL